MLLVLICILYSCKEELSTDINKQVEEQITTKFLNDGTPIRYYSNILIQLQGYPTKQDSMIFKELVETLNVLIDKWHVSLTTKGNANLIVKINMPDREKEMNKIIRGLDNNVKNLNRSVVLNIPPESDFVARRKVIYYYTLRSLVTFRGDQESARPIPGSIFTELKPEFVTFNRLDFEIIKKLYSKDFDIDIYKSYSLKSTIIKYHLPLLANLFAILLSLTFVVILFKSGNFKSHNYEIRTFLKQGLLVLTSITIYVTIIQLYSFIFLFKETDIVNYIAISILGIFLLGLIFLIIMYLIERVILMENDNLLLHIIVPLLSTLIITLILYLILIQFTPIKRSTIIISSILQTVIQFTCLIGIARAFLIFTRKNSENIIRKKDVELAQMGELQKQAELQSLRAKINPHFLYNALNSIASLATTDARKTEQMALTLSDFFKYAINREQKQLNSLTEELNATRTYLEIEKVRFGDRLNFEIDCEPELMDIQIPQLLIQPLVENSIKHGLSQITENGMIRIVITNEGNQLNIRVYDNGPAFPDGPLSGFGIQNTQERIVLLYGSKATINWNNQPEKYIELSLPFVAETI